MTDKMEKIIESGLDDWVFCEAHEREGYRIRNIAKALRDAGYIHRDELEPVPDARSKEDWVKVFLRVQDGTMSCRAAADLVLSEPVPDDLVNAADYLMRVRDELESIKTDPEGRVARCYRLAWKDLRQALANTPKADHIPDISKMVELDTRPKLTGAEFAAKCKWNGLTDLSLAPDEWWFVPSPWYKEFWAKAAALGDFEQGENLLNRDKCAGRSTLLTPPTEA